MITINTDRTAWQIYIGHDAQPPITPEEYAADPAAFSDGEAVEGGGILLVRDTAAPTNPDDPNLRTMPWQYHNTDCIELWEGVYPEEPEFAELLAKARVLAAAPELLAACEAVLAEGVLSPSLAVRMKSVIDKALGTPSKEP